MWWAPGTCGASSDRVTRLTEPSPGKGAGWGSGAGGAAALAQARLSPQPPRPCEAYRAEWNLCRSARHFLHNYYVHGERPACEQWRRDLDSCREWEERRSAEAQVRWGGRGWCWAAGVHHQGIRMHGPPLPTFGVPALWRGVLPGTLLLLCFLSFQKYQKLVCQRGFQTLKYKARKEGRVICKEKRGPLTVLWWWLNCREGDVAEGRKTRNQPSQPSPSRRGPRVRNSPGAGS